MNDSYSDVHKGHRARMRRKFAEHPARTFDTYELLEMLLYHVIPYKDTNPVSKKLLSRFGSLDGTLAAERSALLEVEGVGEAVADFLFSVGEFTSLIRVREETVSRASDPCEAAGKRLAGLLAGADTDSVAMLLLDNRLMPTDAKILLEKPFSSAGVKAEPFLNYAVAGRASAAVTAHISPNTAPLPTLGDRETARMLSDALSAAGIAYLEHFVTDGEHLVGVLGTGRGIGAAGSPKFLEKGTRGASYALGERLERLLGYAACGREAAGDLLEKYLTLERLAAAEGDELARIPSVGEGGAHLLRLALAAASRRYTDLFKLGRRHSEEELISYLEALLYPLTNETVYAVMFDEAGRVLSCEQVGEGTVNSAGILPRRILELAIKRGASAAVLAHNHPSGSATPSEEDGEVTALVGRLLEDSGRRLLAHYVFAGGECRRAEPKKI